MADSMIATTGKAERVRELMRTVGMLPVLILLLGLTVMATLCCHQLAIADWRWQDALWQSWHGVQEGQARVDLGTDTLEFADAFQLRDEVTQVVIFHYLLSPV